MKKSLQLITVLGAAAVLVGTYQGQVANANASAEATEAAAGEEQVLQSYGDTLVVKKEPVDAMFSHKSHVIEYEFSCDTCHPDLFERRRGAAREAGDYTMASLEEGLYCGACHDGDTAFNTVDSDTCITCHGSDMVEPETIVFVKPVKAVVFNHTEHTEMGYECSSCHNSLFETKVGAAEEKPEEFTMAALYDGKYCGGCHNGDDAFASDTQCTTCHIGVQGVNRLHGGDESSDNH